MISGEPLPPVTGDRLQSSFTLSSPSSSVLTSGVGLPASGEELHPNQLPNLHPHPPPDEQVAHENGECQTVSFCIMSFSAQTCLELLRANQLSDEQIKRELNYQKLLIHEPESEFKTRGSVKQMASLTESLATCLEHCASHTGDDLTSDDDTLTNTQLHFSYLVEQAQKCVDAMKALNAATSRSPVTQQPTPTNGTESELTESVCTILNTEFGDLSVAGILEQLPLSDFGRGSCGRRTRYFGALSYSYESSKHEPAEYPDCPLFDAIFDRMQGFDKDFTRSNVTCLVTHYADGESFIRPHSDNEREVAPNSPIYTISVGAARKLRVTSRDHVLREYDFDLSHGTLSSMSSTSQHSWEHEILRDPTVRQPRISFTFRYLVNPGPRTPAPSIEQPADARPIFGDKHRVLLLTDSIAKSTPEHHFGRIRDHRCIKKMNYYLTDVLNFEPEFRFTDVVVVSCGINDLSTRLGARPPLRAHTLADLFAQKFSDCCNRHPNTQFIFNSLLSTKHHWLNNEVDRFNRIMFQQSLVTPNLRFLDTHKALVDSVSRMHGTTVLEPSDPRGTHLTFGARKLVTTQLVNAVELCVGRRSGTITGSTVRGWCWPLRCEFVSIFRQVAATYANR